MAPALEVEPVPVPVPAPEAAGELPLVAPVVEPARLGRALALGLAEVLTPRGEALLLLRPVAAPVAPPVEDPLDPVVEVLVVLPAVPWQGATVGDVGVPPVGEMVTPATLQFSGTCCSMISM